MNNSDVESQRHKIPPMKRSCSSKSSIKSKKKELRRQSLDHDYTHSMDLLTTKPNGFSEGQAQPTEEEELTKQTSAIKGMWKKAFKSLKSNDKQTWLSKRGSLIKRKDSEPSEETVEEQSNDIDPVYSLLKCAADLPKVPAKTQKESIGCPHLINKGDTMSVSIGKASNSTFSGVAQSSSSAYASQHSIESSSSGQRATSPISNREQMHHIVDESLGLEFRTFYRLTSPVRKTSHDGLTKRLSPNSSFDQY